MKTKQIIVSVLLLFALSLISYSSKAQNGQKNDFKIGMFSFGLSEQGCANCCLTKCKVVDQAMDTIVRNGTSYYYPTSQLNVLYEDGFNIVTNYLPCWYSLSPDFMRSMMRLIKNNGMQYLNNMVDFYVSDTAVYHFSLHYQAGDTARGHNMTGTHISPDSNCGVRPNYDTLMACVYLDTSFKDVVWGHKMTEEASYRHRFSNNDTMRRNGDGDSVNLTYTEVPVQNVADAIGHFRGWDTIHKFAIMEAYHNRMIADGMHDIEDSTANIDGDSHSYFQTDEYLRMPNVSQSNKADVFLEGSYINFRPEWGAWYAAKYDKMKDTVPYNVDRTKHYDHYSHYLASQKSIDWAYQYVDNVQDVINICQGFPSDTTSDINDYNLHTDKNKANANFLHFMAYTSIIHKAKGIWFWDLVSCRDKKENSIWNTIAGTDSCFERKSFPRRYKAYVTPLARQLRYLVNKDLLTTDTDSYVAYKTDSSALDKYDIVKPYTSTIPTRIPSLDSDHYYKEDGQSYINGNYDLRYTIRTNGKEDIMIVSNPLWCKATTTLNFLKIAQKDDIIRNASAYSILFEHAFPADSIVDSSSYKIMRDTIDWHADTLPDSTIYTHVLDTAISDIAFGPADVHILSFGPEDNQWYDVLKDRTENGDNKVCIHSAIRTDVNGDIFYINNNRKLCMIDSTSVPHELGAAIPPMNHFVQFAVNRSGDVIYAAGDDNTLYRISYDAASGWSAQTTTQKVSSSFYSNIEMRDGKLFYVNIRGKIVEYDTVGQNIQIVTGSNKTRNSIGFAVDEMGTHVYYQSTDGKIQVAIKSNGVWNTQEIHGSISLRPFSRLHYCDGRIYCVRWSDGVVHQLYQNNDNSWAYDWLDGGAATTANTDIAVADQDGATTVFFIKDKSLYTIRPNGMTCINPSNLVRAADASQIAVCDDKIIYAGAGDRIHGLSYRDDYYGGLDLYIKDSPLDVGHQPNTTTTLFYDSPDIWARNQNDGFVNQTSENPQFSLDSVYVYVKVRNKSNVISSGVNEMLNLYWSNASVNACWPVPWDGSRGSSMGGKIGVRHVGSIRPDDDTILMFKWKIPARRKIERGPAGHYCLLARIMPYDSSIVDPSSLLNLVKTDNNTAWKNITIIDDMGRMYESYIDIPNWTKEIEHVTLSFYSEKLKDGSKTAYDIADVIVIPDSTLYGYFHSRSTGMEEYSKQAGAFIITNREASVDLSISPEDVPHVGLRFMIKNDNTEGKKSYDYQVVLKSTKDGTIIGGEKFVIELPQEEQ